jgi:hypothetical protein
MRAFQKRTSARYRTIRFLPATLRPAGELPVGTAHQFVINFTRQRGSIAMAAARDRWRLRKVRTSSVPRASRTDLAFAISARAQSALARFPESGIVMTTPSLLPSADGTGSLPVRTMLIRGNGTSYSAITIRAVASLVTTTRAVAASAVRSLARKVSACVASRPGPKQAVGALAR